eukprot:2701252-Rhodomonas_salina.2
MSHHVTTKKNIHRTGHCVCVRMALPNTCTADEGLGGRHLLWGAVYGVSGALVFVWQYQQRVGRGPIRGPEQRLHTV